MGKRGDVGNDAHGTLIRGVREALSTGMKLLVNSLETFGIDVGIHLGGGDVGVPEHFLDAP